jgi:hypothetical protein
MTGFIGTWVTSSLNDTQLQRYRYSAHFQFTVAHALEFSVFTSRILATDLSTETSTSNHNEVFFLCIVYVSVLICTHIIFTIYQGHAPFSFWYPQLNCIELTALSVMLEPLIFLRHGLHRKHASRVRLRVHWSVTSTGRGADDIEITVSSIVACWGVFTGPLSGNALMKSLTML